MRPLTRLAVLAAAAAMAAGAQAAGIRSPEMLAHTCAGCHGTGGASAGLSMPTIGGLDRGYLLSVMTDYKVGLRPATIMDRIARGYSDQELAAIAAWFAQQPWVSTDTVHEGQLVAQGRKFHEDKCETCHEDGGRVQDEETPRLAGQWTQYTHYALEVCREQGKRCDPRKMGERVMDLSDEELRALAHYYASEK